jgi:hypothetical protein
MKNNFVKNIFRQNILNKNQTKHKLKEICIHWLLRNWNNPQIKRKVFFFFFFLKQPRGKLAQPLG